MTTATKQAITRSVAFELTRAREDGDGLTMEGYAAMFNEPVRIRNRLEAMDLGLDTPEFDEVIASSAFSKSIQDRTQWPLLMFDHGKHIMIGSMPLGVITHMRADDRGLFVRARLTDNWLTSPVRDAIAAGAVNGMSFRAEPLQERVDRTANPPKVVRTELRAVELGPVVNPQYDTTTVTVRSKAIADALDDPQARQDLVRALLSPGQDVQRAVIGSTDLPVAERSREWDGNAAKDRVFSAFTGEDGTVDTRGVARAFLWRNPDADPQTQAAYSLGIADMVEGRLQIIPRGVAASAGGRGVDAASIPAADKTRIKTRICSLYDRIRREFDDWPECPFRSDNSRSAPPADGHAPDSEAGSPDDGHPSTEPPSGHSSMSEGLVRAQLARINQYIDSAERSMSS